MLDINKMQSLPSNLKNRKYTREQLKCFRECLRKSKRRGDDGDGGDGGGIPQIIGRGLSQPFAQSMHVPLVVGKPSARATFEQPRFQDLRPRRRESQPAMPPQPARPPADPVFLQQPMPQERGGQPTPMPRLQRGDVGMGEIPGFGQMPPREDYVSSSMLGNQASLIADITGEEPEMPRAPPRVFEPRPAPQMPAQVPPLGGAPLRGVPTEQPRFRPLGQIRDRSGMRAEDRQSGARRDFEAEQEREARERGEMVMADIASYDGPTYDEMDFAPAREARQAMRQQRNEELAPMYEATERRRGRRRQRLAEQRERELQPMFAALERRREVRRERAEDEQLQQLLDDAGELVEGADDRDLGDFNPNRYDRERDFDPNRYDRERDFDRERDYE
jgi:hypothetical protein